MGTTTHTNNEYVITRQPMVSGQGEAVSNVYDMCIAGDGRAWFWPYKPELHHDAASNIYVTADPDWEVRGSGFGGSTLQLPLIGGGEFELRGGWHSRADRLYEETGVDLREMHRTFVVIGRGVRFDEHYRTVITDVVYMDPPEGKLGYFTRGKRIAQGLANAYQRPYYEYSSSRGGSSNGWIKPHDKAQEKWINDCG